MTIDSTVTNNISTNSITNSIPPTKLHTTHQLVTMICDSLTPINNQHTPSPININTQSTAVNSPNSSNSTIIKSASNSSIPPSTHQSPSAQHRHKKRANRSVHSHHSIQQQQNHTTPHHTSYNSSAGDELHNASLHASDSDSDDIDHEEYDVHELTPLPKSLCCIVCQLFLYKPITLQCGHSVCISCMKSLVPPSDSSYKPAVCPIISCHKPIINCESLQPCITLGNILDNGFHTEYNYSGQFCLATSYYETERYHSCVNILDSLVNIMPYTVQYYCLRILCYMQLQQFNDAITDTHTAIYVYNHTIHNSRSASTRYPDGTTYTTIDISTATNIAPPLNQPLSLAHIIIAYITYTAYQVILIFLLVILTGSVQIDHIIH